MSAEIPNLHHLELFYHVAVAGGISAAVRAMPYGIQQPAVSAQVGSLEKELGVVLFRRRPFRLTAAGEELFGFVEPFFRRLPEVAAAVAGRAVQRLRVLAPAVVIRSHLPGVLSEVRRRYPGIEISLKDARHEEMMRELEEGLADLAVIEKEGRVPRGMEWADLARLPLVLWLPPGMKVPKRGMREVIGEALIRPPADSVMARLFEKGMKRRGLQWPARMELRTAELVLEYVARGFGVGLGHALPGGQLPEGVRMMRLDGFPELVVGAMWAGGAGGAVEVAVEELRKVSEGILGRHT